LIVEPSMQEAQEQQPSSPAGASNESPETVTEELQQSEQQEAADKPEEGDEGDDQGGEEKPQEKPKRSARERINELTKRAHEAEREAQRLARSAERKPADPAEKPIPDRFGSYDEYVEALADWKLISASPSRSSVETPSGHKPPKIERPMLASKRGRRGKSSFGNQILITIRRSLVLQESCQITSSKRSGTAISGLMSSITSRNTRKRSSALTRSRRWQRQGNSDGSRRRYRIRPRHNSSRPAKRLRRLRQLDRPRLRQSTWHLQTWTSTSPHVANKARHSGGGNPHHHGAINHE
jgi:hypothetical protein